MAPDEPPRQGVVESLRKLCDTGLGLLHNRIELFAVEVQEEKERLVKLLMQAAAVVFLGNMAAFVITLTIVYLVGETARVAVLIGLGVLYLVLTVVAFLMLRRDLKSSSPPFDATVSELKKDREWLNPHK